MIALKREGHTNLRTTENRISWIANSPELLTIGRDEQLEKAVQVLLDELDGN